MKKVPKKKMNDSMRKAMAAEIAAKKEHDKKVMIEKVINLKLMCDYAVSCSYGDIVLIIAMLHDYISLLDEFKGDDLQYQAYYRGRFQHIADHLAEQIGYDYEAAVERCKHRKDDDDDDIGGEATELMIKQGRREAEARERKAKLKEQSEDPQQEEQKGDGQLSFDITGMIS